DYTEVEHYNVPAAFQPVKVPCGLVDINQIFAAGHGRDIFRDRDISKDGGIVVVRPHMYVSAVLPLSARDELTQFFAQRMLEPTHDGTAQYIDDVEISDRASLAIHVED